MNSTLEQAGIIAIIRLPEAGRIVEAGEALVAGGIRALEVSLTTPDAPETIRSLRATLPEHVSVGAGTLITPGDVKVVAAAGASFGVTPVVRPATIRKLKEKGLAAICGASTPTEILTAHEAGADAVKVFPARSIGGPAYIREVRSPLPQISLVPTGGVSLENVEGYVRAGASLLGVGSSLVDPALVEAEDWDTLNKRATAFMNAWQEATTVHQSRVFW